MKSLSFPNIVAPIKEALFRDYWNQGTVRMFHIDELAAMAGVPVDECGHVVNEIIGDSSLRLKKGRAERTVGLDCHWELEAARRESTATPNP